MVLHHCRVHWQFRKFIEFGMALELLRTNNHSCANNHAVAGNHNESTDNHKGRYNKGDHAGYNYRKGHHHKPSNNLW